MGDYSTLYSKILYLQLRNIEKNVYPKEITPIVCQKTKKNRKGILEKLWEKAKGLD